MDLFGALVLTTCQQTQGHGHSWTPVRPDLRSRLTMALFRCSKLLPTYLVDDYPENPGRL